MAEPVDDERKQMVEVTQFRCKVCGYLQNFGAKEPLCVDGKEHHFVQVVR